MDFTEKADSGRTVVSVLRLLRNFCMVAVLEVPDSPTRTTGLFTFTICSSSQLARVVSTVGTEKDKCLKLAFIREVYDRKRTR